MLSTGHRRNMDGRRPLGPIGFGNGAAGHDQDFRRRGQATASYSLTRPPSTGMRLIRCGERDDARVISRCAQVQGAVGSAGVVVLDVFGEHALEVSLPRDQHPVDALGPDGPHDAFGVGFICGHCGAPHRTNVVSPTTHTASHERKDWSNSLATFLKPTGTLAGVDDLTSSLTEWPLPLAPFRSAWGSRPPALPRSPGWRR